MPAKYRVVYVDQRQQLVNADGFSLQGNFVFFSFDGNTVLAIAAANVESIAEDGVPEAQ